MAKQNIVLLLFCFSFVSDVTTALLFIETLLHVIDIVFYIELRSMNSRNSTELSLESKVYFGAGGVFPSLPFLFPLCFSLYFTAKQPMKSS